MGAPSTTIDYDKLYDEYQVGLIERLRNFDVKGSYIELWVPDEDLNKSLLNLFVAARDARQSNLRVALSAKTAARLNPPQLTEAMQALKAELRFTNENGQLVLEASSLSETGPHASGTLKNYSGEREAKRRENIAAHLKRHAVNEDVKSAAEPQDIAPLYKDKCMQSASRPVFSRAPAAENGSLVAEGACGNARLFIAADKTTMMITDIGYAGISGLVGRGLLERFAALCVGLPFQEAADHGVQRLEADLRTDKTARPLPGIALPRTIDPAFRWVELLARSALADWRQRTGYAGIINEFDSGVGAKWRGMQENERMEWLAEVACDLAETGKVDLTGVSITAIEYDVRIVVSMPHEWTSQAKARTLLLLERAIKEHVDPRLELYNQELKDRNATRRLS